MPPTRARESRPKGFVCPSCATPLRVAESRTLARGIVVRRRYCPTCDYRVTTEERPRTPSTGDGR